MTTPTIIILGIAGAFVVWRMWAEKCAPPFLSFRAVWMAAAIVVVLVLLLFGVLKLH